MPNDAALNLVNSGYTFLNPSVLYRKNKENGKEFTEKTKISEKILPNFLRKIAKIASKLRKLMQN